MRILLVDLAKRFGGVDIRILQTARALAGQHDVATVVLEGAPIHTELANEGLTALTVTRARHDPRLIGDILDHARAFGADVIDTHNPQSQLWGMLAARRLPDIGRVATVHTVYRAAHRGGLRQRGHELSLHLARRMGAEFLTVSGSISAYLADLGVPTGRIHLSYNALEPLAAPPAPIGLRQDLGIAPDAPLLGMIGRIEHVKAHDVMLKALAQLKAEGITLPMIIVGEGRDGAAIRDLSQSLGLGQDVHFLGFRRDIPSILAEIDLFCTPSRSEGLPYTALEAARQGVPMIAGAVDGLAEMFTHGETAWMVAPEDVSALANAVKHLVETPKLRGDLGARAKEMIETKFAIPRMAEETCAVYETAIAARRGTK